MGSSSQSQCGQEPLLYQPPAVDARDALSEGAGEFAPDQFGQRHGSCAGMRPIIHAASSGSDPSTSNPLICRK